MWTRILPTSRALAAQTRITGVRRMGSFKPETQVALETRSRISDMPVPAGSWQEAHNKRNAKWNMFLGLSIGFFILTLGATVKGQVWLLHDVGDIRKVKIDPS